MRKKYVKGNLRKSDIVRAVLSDTAPYEVPIIVSNDGFYDNLRHIAKASAGLSELVRTLIVENDRKYTTPYRYKITKDAISMRQLSLPHPSSQYNVVKFYKEYSSVISYFCSNGTFSIRRPVKIGGSYSYKGSSSDQNKYKSSLIDLAPKEKFLRNPSSYFAYAGYQRIYQFFDSNDFMRLEKKFASMWLIDVSKCFSSIYTHTIAWAVKNSDHSKSNVSAITFGNEFDKLMQKMNINETNGICIGPEVSRIFAEIILQDVDKLVVERAKTAGFWVGKDFECRRYVDDYILFSKDEKTAGIIFKIISDSLSEYNLHINEGKLDRYGRPFITKKSFIIHRAKETLKIMFESTIEETGDKLLAPKKIGNRPALVRSFISSVKAICADAGVGYDSIVNYKISSIVKRIEVLSEDYAKVKSKNEIESKLYVSLFLTYIEIVFFLYTVHPTVASSFKVARGVIIGVRFFREKLPEHLEEVELLIHKWCIQAIRGVARGDEISTTRWIPVELLNIVVASRELSNVHSMESAFLANEVFCIENSDYFSLVSCLYYIRDLHQYDDIRSKIAIRVKELVSEKDSNLHSQQAHLALDVISCPFLPQSLRGTILDMLRQQCGLAAIPAAERDAIVSEIEGRPWFVQWDHVDLLNLIQKKELSAVY
ncbi:antiviral reverse transcriptase Drt3b [Azospirillum formosense]|uniref:antiviral reverse transcriptase Drt3b n=1 Tax=Azospirillum formosense TaxID=861533 RepID=UPI00338E2FCA